MQKENFYIEKCKALIEEKLAWGSSATWQNQDFEALSEKIFEATNVRLSTSTLKRLWGKSQYTHTPNLTTLNALSRFVGYDNWRAFEANGFQTDFENEEKPLETFEDAPSVSAPKTHTSKPILWVLSTFLVLGTIVFWAFNKSNKKKLVLKDVHFSSKPVTEGLPNSVIFKYDVSNTNADSVFIQQSWDNRLRRQVDKNQKEYTCTYYSPGFYRAKLIVNDSIVKEHDVFIESQGWLGMIEKMPIPIYFSKKTIEKGDKMGIIEADVIAKGIDFSKATPNVSLTYVDKNRTVPSDNFVLEVELKNTYNKGNGICQHTKIDLLGTENFTEIPLCIKGCVGELNFMGDDGVKDISLFGVNFNDWVKVRFEAKNGHAKIFINNQLAYEKNKMVNIGTIVGTRLLFMGAGEVRQFEMYKL